MKLTETAKLVFDRYESCCAYNSSISLNETVRQNEDFYVGKQWEKLIAPDLDKPVLNFLKRVVNFFVSMIVTDSVGVSVTPHGNSERERLLARALESQVEQVVEQNDLLSLNRDLIRDAAVDGDAALYCYFDASSDSICAERLDNTRVLFGNPYVSKLQKQPYIIISMPSMLGDVRREAKKLGLDESLVMPDETPDGGNSQRVTVLLMFERGEDGLVRFTKCTRNLVLRESINTGMKLYPIAFMSWDKIKDSYHGQAAVTGLIPNQICVNKLWAMALRHQQMLAFPKVFYDRLKIREWTNRVGEAVAVSGNPNEAVVSSYRSADMSAQLLEIVDKTINYTRDFMGASDAALGNVRPDNTSAILAVQKASIAPLELQKLAFYQFVEDYVRIIAELMRVNFGRRKVELMSDSGGFDEAIVDFSALDTAKLALKVDVGASAYWSELAQFETMDNLFAKGILTDAVTYVESIPQNQLKNKNKIVERLREQQANLDEMEQRFKGGRDEMSEM